MRSIEIVSIFIMPITLIYILIFLLMYGQKYLREYSRNKVLKFTQEEVKEKRREIATELDEIQGEYYGRKTWEIYGQSNSSIVKVFSLYNELAVGINEGLYDELYVKMVMGYDMVSFYKNNYKVIVSMSDIEMNSSRFMPLELLLKKWDSGEAPTYRVNKHRRYL